jgi:predicted ArsR family transcriptional regulator
VLLFLRKGPSIVNELAEAFEVTDNAIRAHLYALEKEGLVQRAGTRKGRRRPHESYELTAKAQDMFSKGYAPVLDAVISTLGIKMGDKARKGFLREVGERIAAQNEPPENATASDRIEHALRLFEALGGEPVVEQLESECRIVGHGCPLSSAVRNHPEVCLIAESLLARLLRTGVKTECHHGASPHCRFLLEPLP